MKERMMALTKERLLHFYDLVYPSLKDDDSLHGTFVAEQSL